MKTNYSKPQLFEHDGTCPITGMRIESFSQITNNIKQLEADRRKRIKKAKRTLPPSPPFNLKKRL